MRHNTAVLVSIERHSWQAAVYCYTIARMSCMTGVIQVKAKQRNKQTHERNTYPAVDGPLCSLAHIITLCNILLQLVKQR